MRIMTVSDIHVDYTENDLLDSESKAKDNFANRFDNPSKPRYNRSYDFDLLAMEDNYGF